MRTRQQDLTAHIDFARGAMEALQVWIAQLEDWKRINAPITKDEFQSAFNAAYNGAGDVIEYPNIDRLAAFLTEGGETGESAAGKVCQCGKPAIKVIEVPTIPGDGFTKWAKLDVCETCYDELDIPF